VAERAAKPASAAGSQAHSTPTSPAAEAGTFDRDTAVGRLASERREDGPADGASFAAQIAPQWCINGRPHGGYLAAIILRALLETVGDELRAPRSLTIHFLRAPKPGAARIEVAMERAGGSLSTLSGRIEQDGELIALALAAFSLARASIEVAELPMPEVAAQDPSREMPDWLSEQIERGLAPSFLRKLVLQPCEGARPFSGGEGPMRASAWVGLAEPARPLDAIALALFSDAHFPTPFVRLREPAGAPTIDLTIHFRAPLPHRASAGSAELCLARVRSRVIHEGFFEEDGVIWAADGTVLAQSRQLALLIGSGGG
jgi:acyl-CoA thioesterase